MFLRWPRKAAVALMLAPGSVLAAAQQVEPRSLLEAARVAYSNAKLYRIEVEHSENFKGELSGNWSHSSLAGIVTKDGRYRFEAVGPGYSWLQISNGNFEWLYDRQNKRYLQGRPSAKGNPSQFGQNESSYEQSKIADARDIPESTAQQIGEIRDPHITGTEVLSLKSGDIDCIVIRGPGKYRSGWPPDTEVEFTIWLEKGSNYVRKVEQHWKGELISGHSDRYEREMIDVFNVVDLHDPNLPAEVFDFQAPSTAKLVKNLTVAPTPSTKRFSIMGTVAPDVIFRSSAGQVVPLNSMRGKPVLIEFWATWCAPCVSAFPKLGRFYSELTRDGITVITVDEDEQPQKAISFLAKEGHAAWPNYHDDGEINRLLPGDGLPQFVLIDATGKVVYVTSGFDDQELRKQAMQLLSKASRPAKGGD